MFSAKDAVGEAKIKQRMCVKRLGVFIAYSSTINNKSLKRRNVLSYDKATHFFLRQTIFI